MIIRCLSQLKLKMSMFAKCVLPMFLTLLSSVHFKNSTNPQHGISFWLKKKKVFTTHFSNYLSSSESHLFVKYFTTDYCQRVEDDL